MKLSIYLSCLGVMLALIGNVAAKEDPRIVEIRKWYNEIEGKKHVRTSFNSGKDEEPQMVKMTRYETANGKLRKLYVEAGGDHGFRRTTYYYKNGLCFFVFETTNTFKFTGKELANGESEVMDIASEYRYYFNKGECIKCLGKKIELIGGDELNALLKQKKNESFEPVAAMNDYAKAAQALAGIKTKKALMNYFFK